MQQRRVHARPGRHARPGGSLLSSHRSAGAAGTPEKFDEPTLALLNREQEVDIETVRKDGTQKRTTIWIVVDGDEAYVRSWLGDRGHWYHHALERPDEVRLHIAGHVIPVRAAHVTDEDSIQRCSRGFEKKYANSMSTAAMVSPKVQQFTMRIDPR